MNHVLFAAGMIEDTARTFGVDWPHFIAQVLSFGIVTFLLHRFAYKPILKVLEERRQRIEEGLANAERIKAEVAKTEVQRQEILTQANAQANKLIEEGRAAAERLRDQETRKAMEEAERIIAQAHEAAEQDSARKRAELRREIGRLAVQVAINVTGKILTPQDQQRLAEETTRVLAA